MNKKLLNVILTIIIICLSVLLYILIMHFNKEPEPIEKEPEIDPITEKLSHLGYKTEDISYIKETFTEEQINLHLLSKKYKSLINYSKSKGFNIENLERYESYKQKNKTLKEDKIVLYTEIGLDKEFYSDIKTIDTFDKLCLVNKYYRLPENYSAENLVTLDKNYSSSSQKMKKEAANYMKSLIDDAKKEGYNLTVISGYRTQSLQNTLFTNSEKKNGLEHALMYSAKPGHSEHQTGYAADLNSVEESFADTKEYTWLKENAYKYGFIERYPKGKEFITGYGYEPWHYRYVGINAATIIQNEQITFEEYYIKYIKS
ncbi:MAG: M15 family metallopeptidase [Bacilli bacterium]|nr:M15 family metallopeptidase [Bacilli bacterium]